MTHFARHVFLASWAHKEKVKTRDDVYSYLDRMRKSIIKMNLNYSDIDRLKEKIDCLVDSERRYSRFFHPDDRGLIELKKHMQALENELADEKKEKQRMTEDHGKKITQMANSLEIVKSNAKQLMMEKAKRQQKLRALEQRIRQKVDVSDYYYS